MSSSNDAVQEGALDVRLLLDRVRADNEADLAAARRTLETLAEEGAEHEGTLSNVATSARHMIADAERILAEVTAAEDRLAAGTFGRCTGCGTQIPDARLELRPYVRTCVACVDQ